ncbi:MAG: PAS domain S-box protein [Halorhabdus sp.]
MGTGDVADQAFEKAATIMVVLAADGTIDRINDRGCAVLGYDRATLLGENWFERVVPEDSDTELEDVLKGIRSNAENEFDVHENMVRTDEGEIRHVKWHVTVIEDETGEIQNLLVSGSDITDRVETEQRLRRYKQVVESSTNLLAAVDREYTYILTNRRYREFHGIDEEHTTLTLKAVLGEDRFEAVKPKVDRTLAGGTAEYEMIRSNQDGTERVFDIRYYPLQADGDVAGVVAAINDVTEREERERQLRREVDRLEEFASVISHDLRNPLNVAQGRLTLLEEDCASEHIAPIDRSLDRMEAIIEKTLTLARKGKAVGETQPVAMATVVDACWKAVATEDATMELLEEFTIEADPDRLQHVFENLFRNAVEHAGSDVTVRIGRAGTDGFYVADDGPGIPPENREKVFEPGFTTQKRGTGFGLTIVREIAEAHGWSVSVTEGDRGGAHFVFEGVDVVE